MILYAGVWGFVIEHCVPRAKIEEVEEDVPRQMAGMLSCFFSCMVGVLKFGA